MKVNMNNGLPHVYFSEAKVSRCKVCVASNGDALPDPLIQQHIFFCTAYTGYRLLQRLSVSFKLYFRRCHDSVRFVFL